MRCASVLVASVSPPTPLRMPPTAMLPEFTLKVRVAPRIMSRLRVWRSASLLVTFPARVMRFPVRTKAPAVLLKVMFVKAVSAAKSFTGPRRVVPPKVSELPANGAVPPQFVPVVQLSFAPPPFQVWPQVRVG